MVLLAAVEGGGTTWVAALAEGTPDNIIERIEVATTTPEETLGLIKQWLDERSAKIDALGIATFGPIDPDKASSTYGYITTTPKPGWKNANVVGRLSDGNIPCRFDTDVNAPALAEFQAETSTTLSSCAYITVGTGVGVGLVINGKPVHGLLHPEGGHIPVFKLPGDTFPGTCPYHGDCVEGLTSTGSLAKRQGIQPADLPQIPDDADVWNHCANALGSLCASILLLTSTQRIVLSGGVMLRESLFPKIRAACLRHLNGYVPKYADAIDSIIVPSRWKNDAGIIGALTLAQSLL